MKISANAILFDNDGVLVDSHAEVVAGWTQMAGEFGLDIDELLTHLVGVRAVDTLRRHLPPDQIAAAARRVEEVEIDLADKTRPLTGAIELLHALGGSAWTIVTSGSRLLATARWSGAGIPIPSNTVTADDVSRGKPDPEPFLVGAQALGVEPGQCVVFEDSPSGGEAGRAAGMTVVAVGEQPWPFEPAARIVDLSAVSVVVAGAAIELELTVSD